MLQRVFSIPNDDEAGKQPQLYSVEVAVCSERVEPACRCYVEYITCEFN